MLCSAIYTFHQVIQHQFLCEIYNDFNQWQERRKKLNMIHEKYIKESKMLDAEGEGSWSKTPPKVSVCRKRYKMNNNIYEKKEKYVRKGKRGTRKQWSYSKCFNFSMLSLYCCLAKVSPAQVDYPTNKQTCHWRDDIGPTGDWPFAQLKRNLISECVSIVKKARGIALCKGQMREIPIFIIPTETTEKKPSNRMLVGFAKMALKAAFVPFLVNVLRPQRFPFHHEKDWLLMRSSYLFTTSWIVMEKNVTRKTFPHFIFHVTLVPWTATNSHIELGPISHR